MVDHLVLVHFLLFPIYLNVISTSNTSITVIKIDIIVYLTLDLYGQLIIFLFSLGSKTIQSLGTISNLNSHFYKVGSNYFILVILY